MNIFYKQSTLPADFSRKIGATPARIGPYPVEKLINRGGMGVLYLGRDPTTHQLLAIKVLSQKFVNNPEATQRFLQEAHIISSTRHPHIVAIYGEGTWEGGLYIAMEYIDGITLSRFIAQKKCSLKRAIDLLLQIASALAHLHKEGIVHRDLKPENILLNTKNQVKVIDFGIAQLHQVAHAMKPGEMVGTPNYLSPEQRHHPDQAGFASDIYAFGVIAYELILGKLSYGAIELSKIPLGIRPIIEKALAFSVKDRYIQFVDIISDLRRYLASADLDKDRSKSDVTKEMQETLQELHARLFSPHIPLWPDVEIGYAIQKRTESLGFYCDFFKYADQKKMILCAESVAPGIQASIHIALFKGMAYGLLHGIEAPDPVVLLDALHALVREAIAEGKIFLQIVLLDSGNDMLTYASCGCGGCMHISEGQAAAHPLHAENIALGDTRPAVFNQGTCSWLPGDRIIFHSLSADQNIEKHLINALEKNRYLSVQGQADVLCRALPPLDDRIKTVVGVRRLD